MALCMLHLWVSISWIWRLNFIFCCQLLWVVPVHQWSSVVHRFIEIVPEFHASAKGWEGTGTSQKSGSSSALPTLPTRTKELLWICDTKSVAQG